MGLASRGTGRGHGGLAFHTPPPPPSAASVPRGGLRAPWALCSGRLGRRGSAWPQRKEGMPQWGCLEGWLEESRLELDSKG